MTDSCMDRTQESYASNTDGFGHCLGNFLHLRIVASSDASSRYFTSLSVSLSRFELCMPIRLKLPFHWKPLLIDTQRAVMYCRRQMCGHSSAPTH